MQSEIEALRIRLAKLNEATLRISEDLDINSVLQNIVDGACGLTDARYGAILVFDRNGGIEYFVTSGVSQEERNEISSLPKGEGLLGYINELRAPLMLGDIADHPKSAGFPKGHPPMSSLLAAPLYFREERVGNIYLTNKADKAGLDNTLEFGPEDSETIIVFASHAASAIANARRYRDERQAKADLEALLDTSPVGVLVFDAKTAELLSLNQETRRIVRGLRVPGRSYQELRSVLSLHRPDGREIPPNEIVIDRVARTGQTVRAEEVIIDLPGGQSVSTIVNASPVFSNEGEVVTVIATIQDMTPLERLERVNSEFMDMVTHQLRIPIAAIKGFTATALSASSAFDHSEMRLFLRVIDEQADQMRNIIGNLLDMTQINAGTISVFPEPTDVEELIESARHGFLQRGGVTNPIETDLPSGLPQIEADRSRMAQVLHNLFTYASLFSPDQSTITVSASVEEIYVAISVAFEGRGVPSDDVPQLFRKSALDGRNGEYRQSAKEGLGLVVCRGIVEAQGGRILAEKVGQGQEVQFTFTVPIAEAFESHPAADKGQGIAYSERTAASRERIVVMDDDQRLLLHLRNILRDEGYNPLVTSMLQEAKQFVASELPNLNQSEGGMCICREL